MKNQYKITKDLMQTWAKEYHLHGAANVILFIIWCVLGVIGISGLIFSIALHSEWMAIYIYALLTIIAVFKLFLVRFVVWSKRYKLYSTTYGVSEWIRTTEFLDDEIILTDHTSVSKLKYSNIEKIKEKNNVVMIFMNNNMALRLYKDAFVEGSWEECKKKSMICSNKINPDRFKICRGYLCLLRSNYAFLDRRGRRSLQGKIKHPYENHALLLFLFFRIFSPL